METHREEMCKSLSEWFTAFYKENCQSDDENDDKYLNDLSDGIAIAQALRKLAPDYFTGPWFSKLKVNVGTNWRLKVSNLKKITETVFDYYGEVLNITINEFGRPNAMKIAEENDPNELGRFLQLILGCAINCSSKMVHIQQFMELEESVQRNIMQAIQELEITYQGAMASKSASIGNFDTKTVQEDRDRLAQKCHEAERQVALLLEEKSSLQQELNRIQRELDSHGSPKGAIIDDDGTSLGPMVPGSNRYNDLRRQLETLKEELLQAEAQRDDFKIKSVQLEEELVSVRIKLDDNSQTQDQIAQLQDELDALREANDKLKVSEALITTYKKKLEDYSDLKRQVKQLEDRNAEYVQQNLHQEENVKKLSALKGQIELYKREIQELHEKLDFELNKCVKIEFELSNANAKVTALKRENENLARERDTLLEKCDELRCSEGGAETAISNAISNELTLPAQRERMRQLEEENKALREGQGGQTALEQMLEDANQRSEKLREQLRAANQKILSLTAQTGGEGEEASKIVPTKESLETTDQKALHNENARLQSKLAQLEQALNAREQEIMVMESRYRKCIEKAKDVIKCYEPRLITDSPRTTDKNTDSESELLVASGHSQAAMSPLEERLVASAFHNLAISCQRDVVDARLALINGGGQSFLSRQRQPPTRKSSLNKRTK